MGKTTFIRNMFAPLAQNAHFPVADAGVYTGLEAFASNPEKLCTEVVVRDEDNRCGGGGDGGGSGGVLVLCMGVVYWCCIGVVWVLYLVLCLSFWGGGRKCVNEEMMQKALVHIPF